MAVSVGTVRYVKCGCSEALPVFGQRKVTNTQIQIMYSSMFYPPSLHDLNLSA